MNLLRKIADWINPKPPPFPTYRIEGFSKEGYPVWACGQTQDQTMEIYRSFGGDPEKANWI